MHNISNNRKKRKVAIVGAHGYSGRELARLVLIHPQLELACVFSRDPSWRLSDDLPEAAAEGISTYGLSELAGCLAQLDIVFLATPVDVSMQLAPELLAQDIIVIDLSGAFRLPADQFEHWYGQQHTAAILIARAQYGLSPWWHSKSPQDITLIANPGCYATCALMALLPLLQAQLILHDNIVVDAKSGVSGAGRKASEALLFCEVDNDFYPYKIGRHQHMPEIAHAVAAFAGVQAKPMMVTHLLPVKRGILVSIYAQLQQSVRDLPAQELQTRLDAAFAQAYKNYPLVKYGYLTDDKQDKRLISLQQVTGSARVHIAYKVYGDQLLLFACLDNLMKGAASQAIENVNILSALPLETGLLAEEGLL